VRVLPGRRARTEAIEPLIVAGRTRLVAIMVIGLLALCALSTPAVAKDKKADRDGRRHRVVASNHRKASPAEKKARGGTHGQKRKFVKLTSLVATVDGVSVAPDDAEPQVKDARLHRPSEPARGEAQAAAASTPAPSSDGGMLNFLIAALLLASLAAWLIRQVGPLRE
jgi:hypothetical protein